MDNLIDTRIKFNQIFFGLVALMLITVFEVHAQDTGKIRGTVVSQKDSIITDVNISVLGTYRGASSNKDGRYIITNLSAGEYILRVTAIGYKMVKTKVNVQAGETVVVDIALQKRAFQLEEITVKGGGLENHDRIATVNSVDIESIKDLHLSNSQKILNQIPGVEINEYNQGGVADVFTMRGFNGAGHEGQAAMEVDGISLNEGEGAHDGYADMNLIIPLNISNVDVYKGPSSVLFGRYGKAGTLAFETRKGGNYQDISLKGGSYNTFDGQIALGQPFDVGDKKLRTNFAAQLYRTKGYTENSEFLKGNINGRIAYDLNDKTDIALNLKGYSGEWDAPGYIPGSQFYDEDRRNKQAKNAENDGGSKNFASERIDINHSFNKNLRLLVFGYSVQQKFTSYRKFGIEPGGQFEDYKNRNVYAAGANLNGRHSLGSVGVNWVAGIEFYDESTDSKNWDTKNRIRQDLKENRNYRIKSLSGFGKAEFTISSYFRPTVGFRYDVYNGSLKLRDPGEPNDKKSLNDLSHFSPKVGFRSTLFKGFDFKANISSGFTLPSGVTRYNSDMDVDPSEIWQYEAGVDYAYKNLFDLSLTGFLLNTSDEITETAPESGKFINSGKTQRRGIELGLEAQPLKRLNVEGSFTYTKTEIKENVNKDLEGNEIQRIPRTTAKLSVDYTLRSGLGARLKVRDTGKYVTGTDNSNYYSGYTVTDAEVFYNFGGGSTQRGQLFFELNNVFNKNYATYVFDSYGSQDIQMYAPAPLRNFSVGITYNL